MLPDTRNYSDSDGYEGTLTKGSGWLTGETPFPSNPKVGDTFTMSRHYDCDYTGTVSRTINIGNYSGTVSKQVSIWIPNIVSYNNYTGFWNNLSLCKRTVYKSLA